MRPATLTLPGPPRNIGRMTTRPASAPVPAPHAAPPEHTGAGGGGRDVLVVDDSAIARAFLAQRLTVLRYRVQVAQNGEEALAMCAKQTFVIVFLDVALGGENSLDGLRVCQRLKRHPRLSDGFAPAVVVVTGDTGSSTRVRGALAGCDAYLTKPLMDADFLAALGDVDPHFEWKPTLA